MSKATHAPPAARPEPSPPLPLQAVFVWGMWALILGVALWRVVLAAQVAASSSLVVMQGAVVIQWRRLDEFVPWMAIGVLLLVRGLLPESVRQGRVAVLLGGMAGVGVVLAGGAMALDQSDREGAGAAAAVAAWGGVVALAGCGLALAVVEVRAILRAMQRGGATILDIWRFAAAQWGLLMVAGLVFMAISVRREDLLGGEQYRNLIFMLPAAGVLPNALMAAGILWWDRVARARAMRERIDLRAVAGVPRVRAWGVAFLLVNAGGLLLVMRAAWTGIPGAVFELLAILFYLLGFPREFWRGIGGKMVLLAWGLIALALGARLIECIMLLKEPTISTFYSGAWRHIWSEGIVLALLGLGAIAACNALPKPALKWFAAGAAVFMVTGILLTAGVWLATAARTGESQVPVMQWVIAGTLPELLAVVAAGVGIMLASR